MLSYTAAKFRGLCAVICFVLAACSAPSLHGQSKGSFLVGSQGERFWNLMSTAPYAQDGSQGFVIYMLSYSKCPNCLNFLHEFYEPRKSRIQLREVFVAVQGQEFLNEAADVALTRDPERVAAYYQQAHAAPPVGGSPGRQVALQKVQSFTAQFNGVMTQIHHVVDAYPTFVLREKEPDGSYRTIIVSGWGADFARDLEGWLERTGADQ